MAIAEVFDFYGCPRLRVLQRQVAIRDESANGVPVIGAGNVPEYAAAVQYGFFPHHNRVWIVQGEAAEFPGDPPVPDFDQGVPPHEVALVESDGPADAGLAGVVLRVNIRAPQAVSLFKPERVERAAAERDETVSATGLPERVPQAKPELGRRVDFPSQFSHVRNAQRKGGNGTDPDLPCGKIREGPVGQIVVTDPLKDPAGFGPPQAQAAIRGGHVGNVNGAFIPGVEGNPGQVPGSGRAREDQESVGSQPGNGQVGGDSTP